jgi:hypothetical protein
MLDEGEVRETKSNSRDSEIFEIAKMEIKKISPQKLFAIFLVVKILPKNNR